MVLMVGSINYDKQSPVRPPDEIRPAFRQDRTGGGGEIILHGQEYNFTDGGDIRKTVYRREYLKAA
jgi:hypothetical protein